MKYKIKNVYVLEFAIFNKICSNINTYKILSKLKYFPACQNVLFLSHYERDPPTLKGIWKAHFFNAWFYTNLPLYCIMSQNGLANFNSLKANVSHHIETSQLTGFYVMGNTGS